MREAMAQAEVGDDVYGEDPSVNRLQELGAEKMGMEAGLFVPSGTMGNLAAVLAHCNRGDEVILGNLAHTFLYEAGGMAALGGVQPHLLPNQADGRLDLEDLREAVRTDDAHFPISRLITIENTHNRKGGAYLTPEYTQEVADFAHENNLKLHIDGARIFNAAAAQNIPASQLTQMADSVTFCLSKALSAPVGSVLCGSEEFIRKAHRARKQLGGGMRQAGVLAAAGIVALEQMVDRLAEDHQRAKNLAAEIEKVEGLSLVSNATNMVYFEVNKSISLEVEEFTAGLREKKVLLGAVGGRRFRMVTHCWVDDQALETAIKAISEVIGINS